MLYLDYNHRFDQLRKLAIYLNADFKEFQDAATLTFNNEFGKGRISSYNIYNGLSVRVYDVVFAKDMHISKKEYADSTIYFLYCVEGHFFHRFENQADHVKIKKRQNVILSSISDTNNEVIFPGNVHLGMTAIFLKENIEVINKRRKTLLETVISDISTIVDKNRPFSYFGELSPLTAQYASILLNNERNDPVGKLLIEGAVMNTLATQIESHDKAVKSSKFGLPLSNTEIKKMSEIAEFIADNIGKSLLIADISKKFGLSPKKLQVGARYVFGETLGNFITDLRLEHGLKLIQTTDLNISEICYQIGISSRSYFSKTFNERFGMLPSKFKEALLNDQMIFEITYKSTMAKNLDLQGIKEIVETSTKNNEKNSITGCLVCQDGSFFQLLEGNKSKVLEIFNKIKEDNRHYDVIELTKKVNTKRIFPKWNLALLSDTEELNQELKQKALKLDIEMGKLLHSETEKINEVFWRKVLNRIKVSHNSNMA